MHKSSSGARRAPCWVAAVAALTLAGSGCSSDKNPVQPPPAKTSMIAFVSAGEPDARAARVIEAFRALGGARVPRNPER